MGTIGNVFVSGKALYKQRFVGRRIWEVDAIRGFCILLMIVDHAMFNFTSLDGWFSNLHLASNDILYRLYLFACNGYWNENYRIITRVVVICLFLFLSGISCTFSKNNLMRAIKLLVASLALTFATIVITNLFGMDLVILFGILHCLALSVTFYVLIKLVFKAKTKYACAILGFAIMLVALTYEYYFLPYIPEPVTFKGFLDVVLGYGAYGSDYFGIVPYTGVFLAGAYFGELYYSKKISLLPKLDKLWHKPLTFIGRNTLWVYLLHQPIVLGVIILIGLMLGYKM